MHMLNDTTPDLQCDVAVVGGGPAGSTVSALLAEMGWRVILFEKERHPRFHIGESLLPLNLPILQRLGVLEQVREIGVVKHGAEFNSDEHPNGRTTFYFRDAMDKDHPYAFQVRRSEFDHLLLKNSAAKGVDVREAVRVLDVQRISGDRSLLAVVDEAGVRRTWSAAFVIDASGRDTFLARRLKLKRKNPTHNTAAIFSHFEGVTRRPGADAGNIAIYWFPHGWFWMIPLRDGSMSVGAVCWPEYLKQRTSAPEAFLWETIRLCPSVHARMDGARMIAAARATGNYSYSAGSMYGDGFLLVGDAFAFVDPVFSSGVFLAMNGAAASAEVVDRCLRQPGLAPKLLARHERRMRRGIRSVSWFIHRFTSPAMHQMFMAPRNIARMQEAVISILAGDFYRKTPIGVPLALFKAVYYITAAKYLRHSWSSFRRRRRSTSVAFTGGTTPQDLEV